MGTPAPFDLEAAFFDRLEEVNNEVFRLRTQVLTLNEQVLSLSRELLMSGGALNPVWRE